tara:strand:+ start:6788 stop:7675 length:888 start_codon:yes stop_codon:yes gene_type:complete
MTRQFKVYPSAAGVVENNLVVTSKSHICLRSQWFKHHGVKTGDINNIYKLIGDYWEGRTAKDLRKGNLDAVIEGTLKIEAEKTYRADIGGVATSGRGDFIKTCVRTGKVFVVECKAVASSARRSKCVRKREPDDAHVIQIVITMLLAGATEGELRYAYVHFDNEHEDFMIPFNTDKGDSRATMPVEILPDGSLMVDNKQAEFGIEDIFAYMNKATKEVPGNTLPDRPFVDPTNPYSSPCTRCVFASTCDASDAEEMITGKHLAKCVLLAKAQKNADEEAPFVPKIFRPKRRVEGD